MYHNPYQIGNNSKSGRVVIHILCHMRAMNTPVCPFTCRISVRFLAPWSTCSASHKDDCKIYKGPWSLILAGTLTRSWWTASILPSCGRELTTRAPSRV